MNIIITGASRGIGYETAKLLSAEHKIIAISRSAEKNKLPGITALDFDFENGDITKELLPEIKKHFESVDVLVNNAAALIKKPFDKISRKDFEKIFSVNVFSIAELTQAVIPLMTSPLSHADRDLKSRSTSHVLNIASMGGIQGSMKFPGLSAYSSSKGALITLTECLAEEYKGKGISFNCIALGSVQTEMLGEAFPGFKAPVTAKEAAEFVTQFAITGQKYFNGKILQMALSTP
ncbi:MAG: SDR family oxidoreductase [Bacteroidetes bacterium]|nr:MAG: SDR family oxidoreductase [Bacteroidota bacterium]